MTVFWQNLSAIDSIAYDDTTPTLEITFAVTCGGGNRL